MKDHIFVGFGFGPIQSGLFVSEAFASGNFLKIVISEVDQPLVEAVRANNGTYFVNVARKDGIDIERIDNIEMLNPTVDSDRDKLLEYLGKATEIVTSLPSVSFYDLGDNSVASLIACGLQSSKVQATVVYAAENNNHAAEILEKSVSEKSGSEFKKPVRFLNTVIGKMSQVSKDSQEIKEKGLTAICLGIERAFLVEEFNKILVTKCDIDGFRPGIEVFLEKDDLLPFEEAKLYGHNAIHALLAYLGAAKGYAKMTELKDDKAVMKIARDAFLNECGAALIKKYSHLGDELFTELGFREYAEDLLERMTNPYLSDTIARAARDPERKLSLNDRIFGTMQLALEYGIEPVNMAKGARAGIEFSLKHIEENKASQNLHLCDGQKTDDTKIEQVLSWLWKDETCSHQEKIVKYVQGASLAND